MKLQTLLLALVLAGCSTSSKYKGPISDKPLLTVTYMRHMVPDLDPRLPEHLETLTTANVTNPSNEIMHVVLDCTASFHPLDIAPRTTEHVLLDPMDSSCELK